MPVSVVIITGIAIVLRLLVGDYSAIKPSLFVAAVSAMAIGFFLFCLKRDIRDSVGMRMMAIAVCMPLLAWALPNLWMLYGLMCLWVPFMAGYFSPGTPSYASRFNLIVPVYLFSLLLLPELKDTLAIGSLKLVSLGVHHALALGAAITIFLSSAKGKCRKEWDIVAFSVVAVIAVAEARETSFSHHIRSLLEVTMALGLPYYIASRGLRTGNDLRLAMLWLGAAGVFLSGILLFEFQRSWPIYNELYPAYDLNTLLLVKMRAGMLRAGGPFVEPTSAAMLLGICSLALYLSREYFRTRWHHLLVMAAAIVGLVAPQSRGAWTGLCLAIAIADGVRGRYAALAVKLSVVGGAAGALFLSASFSPVLSEMLGLSGGSAETSDYRRLLLDRGWEEFLKSPILGYSMPDLQRMLVDLIQGEGIIDFVNAYVWIMLIAGIGGLFVFTGSYVYFLYKIWRTGRLSVSSNRDANAGAFAFAVIAMMMEMFFFTSFGTRPAMFLFVLFGFSAAFLRLQREARRAVAAGEQPSAPLITRPVDGLVTQV